VNAEKIIAEIEWLERLFRPPDERSPEMPDSTVENQEHDGKNASDPWFRLPRVEWLEQLFRLPDDRPLLSL
jgi:hypothetical protein